jgi:AbrB family looped-hinge helix DNA binding protein
MGTSKINYRIGRGIVIAMKVSEGGRVVIPAEIRKALDLKERDTVLWELEEGGARLSSRRQRLDLARQLFQRFLPKAEQRSLVKELISERRAEARHEGRE